MSTVQANQLQQILASGPSASATTQVPSYSSTDLLKTSYDVNTTIANLKKPLYWETSRINGQIMQYELPSSSALNSGNLTFQWALKAETQMNSMTFSYPVRFFFLSKPFPLGPTIDFSLATNRGILANELLATIVDPNFTYKYNWNMAGFWQQFKLFSILAGSNSTVMTDNAIENYPNNLGNVFLKTIINKRQRQRVPHILPWTNGACTGEAIPAGPPPILEYIYNATVDNRTTLANFTPCPADLNNMVYDWIRNAGNPSTQTYQMTLPLWYFASVFNQDDNVSLPGGLQMRLDIQFDTTAKCIMNFGNVNLMCQPVLDNTQIFLYMKNILFRDNAQFILNNARLSSPQNLLAYTYYPVPSNNATIRTGTNTSTINGTIASIKPTAFVIYFKDLNVTDGQALTNTIRFADSPVPNIEITKLTIQIGGNTFIRYDNLLIPDLFGTNHNGWEQQMQDLYDGFEYEKFQNNFKTIGIKAGFPLIVNLDPSENINIFNGEFGMDQGAVTVSFTITYNEITYVESNAAPGQTLFTQGNRGPTTREYQCQMYSIYPQQYVITPTLNIQKIVYPAIYVGEKPPVVASNVNNPTVPTS